MPSATSDAGAHYRLIVIGVSTGGMHALKTVLGALPADFPLPILIVQHMSAQSEDVLAQLLDELCQIHVKEANEEERLTGGCAYLAPANYHLLVERNATLSLTDDLPVNFARPSVDVLFESAAAAFGSAVIGIILTGAGFDGGRGAKRIKDGGGLVIVQDPADAEAPSMPEHALSLTSADHVIKLEKLAPLLLQLVKNPSSKGPGDRQP